MEYFLLVWYLVLQGSSKICLFCCNSCIVNTQCLHKIIMGNACHSIGTIQLADFALLRQNFFSDL